MDNEKNIISLSLQQPEPVVVQCMTHDYDSLFDRLTGLSEAHNQELLTLLSEIISLIHQVINNSGASALSIGVISALAGAFSAFIFNVIFQLYLNKRQKQSNLVEMLLLSLDNINSMARDYWIEGYRNEIKCQIYIQEIKIKSELALLRKIFEIYKSTDNRKNRDMVCKDIDDFLKKSYDLITGDQFESVDRLPSNLIATEIAILFSTAKLKILPRVLRIKSG